MCGIVGTVTSRDAIPILLDGLARLEYRGYDSAGIAVVQTGMRQVRVCGRVEALRAQVQASALAGGTGIAHTRWATHGVPSERNAHPQISKELIAVVHNGIIENHAVLRSRLQAWDYAFVSDTDTEVIPHLIHHHYVQNGGDLAAAVQSAVAELEGSYAIAVVAADRPGQLVCARRGSPLVLGIGEGACYCASDVYALLPYTRRFVHLEDGDVADVREDCFTIRDGHGAAVERSGYVSALTAEDSELGPYRHYMHKEIHEQPQALANTIAALSPTWDADVFGAGAGAAFAQTQRVAIVACGTSYHAGLIARHWIEQMAQLPCEVEIASEFRYRQGYLATQGLLLVLISQSGETADTLGALLFARARGVRQVLSICNVAESSLTRVTDLHAMTHAGPEIGVASTKAFTTQLVVLHALAASLAKVQARADTGVLARYWEQLQRVPQWAADVLLLEPALADLAQRLSGDSSALFIARGLHYPVAMEGALKLKEISYIHAEAYAAGELKHGTLALVSPEMPVIALAPNDGLVEKMQSNMQEVRARGGRLLVLADQGGPVSGDGAVARILLAGGYGPWSPLPYAMALQLLAYHVAVLRGRDVDKPRNLAKSVTVE